MKKTSTHLFYGLSGLSLCVMMINLATKLSFTTPEVPITNTELVATAAPDACASPLQVGTLSITSNLCAGPHTYSYDNTNETGITFPGVVNGHLIFKNGSNFGGIYADDEYLLGGSGQRAFNFLNIITADPGDYCIVTFAWVGLITDIDGNVFVPLADFKAWLNSLSCSSFTEYCFTVNPVPAAEQFGTAPAICSGNPFSIDLNARITNGVASTFTWFASVPAGISGSNGDCLGNSCGSSINETLTNSTTEPLPVTYTVTATSASGCSVQFSITIVINPVPIAMASNKSICSGDMTELDVTDPRNITGANFNWTAEYDGVTGGAGSAMGVAFGTNAINETLTNNTNAPIDVVYTITPLTSSCSGPSIEVRVTVNPNPEVTLTLNDGEPSTICTGASVNITARVTSGQNCEIRIERFDDKGNDDPMDDEWVLGASAPNALVFPVSTGSLPPGIRRYRAVVLCGPVDLRCTNTSEELVITVLPDPEITLEAESNQVCIGKSTALEANITFDDGDDNMNMPILCSITFQKYNDGTEEWENIENETYMDVEMATYNTPTDLPPGEHRYRAITVCGDDLGCEDRSEEVIITVLNVDCGTFPWRGNE